MKWFWFILWWILGMLCSGVALWTATMFGDDSTIAYLVVWAIVWAWAVATGWRVGLAIYSQAYAEAHRDAKMTAKADLDDAQTISQQRYDAMIEVALFNKATRSVLRRFMANVSTANVILAKSDGADQEAHLTLVVPRRVVEEAKTLLGEK